MMKENRLLPKVLSFIFVLNYVFMTRNFDNIQTLTVFDNTSSSMIYNYFQTVIDFVFIVDEVTF